MRRVEEMNGISRRDFIRGAGLGAACFLMPGLADGAKARGRVVQPNIIFIMLDDLGKEWVHCYGSEEELTPEVDKLAAGGMLFENAYSMPQCTPTRASLLSGQYPFRTGWINHWDVPRWGAGCHFDWKHYTTFARVLKTVGYATAAAGKWQINDFRVTPDAMARHGFDDYCMWTGYETGVPASGKRYWDPYIHTKEGSKTYEGKFGEDVFTDFLIDFMKRNKDKPMLMYYPMALTHGPFTTTPAEPNAKGKEEQHRAMVRYCDILLGRLTGALEELGIRDDTIIIWTTDNGTSKGMSAMMNGRKVSGGKAMTSENGVCEPFIVNCPGLVPAGVRTDALTDFTDMLPTFAELGGAKLPKDRAVDGKSIAKVILGRAKDSPREWIMAMGCHAGTLNEAGRVVPVHEYRDRVIRDKRYKLYVGLDRRSEKLFDLVADPGESENLLESRDAKVVRARRKLEAVAKGFPEKDAAPQYDATPAQVWDRKPAKKKSNKERRVR